FFYRFNSVKSKSFQAPPGHLNEDQWVRQRVQSMDAELFFRKADQPWRPRVFSAPPNAAVSVKYGRRLRRIADEFDILLEKGMKRMCNGRPASQIRRFPMSLSFLWSHEESDAERRSH
uniref:Uncharacterized protein n=1 Tax=Sinocyclocheilus rhinocerous TaxID=307959 RepID=A0A673MJJ4_9TELE